MVFEPRVGGHVYDVGTDGSECRWSRCSPGRTCVAGWTGGLERFAAVAVPG
jgi:hypothetical protein